MAPNAKDASHSVTNAKSAAEEGGRVVETAIHAMDEIAQKLNRRRKVLLVTPEMVARLSPVDQRSYEAGFMGSDDAGLYKPGPEG